MANWERWAPFWATPLCLRLGACLAAQPAGKGLGWVGRALREWHLLGKGVVTGQ